MSLVLFLTIPGMFRGGGGEGGGTGPNTSPMRNAVFALNPGKNAHWNEAKTCNYSSVSAGM